MYELFPAFICANNTESLLNSFFGVSALIHVPSFTSSSSPSSGDRRGASADFLSFSSSSENQPSELYVLRLKFLGLFLEAILFFLLYLGLLN